MKKQSSHFAETAMRTLVVFLLVVVFHAQSWGQAPQAIVQRSLDAHTRSAVLDIVAKGTTTVDGVSKPTTVYVKPGRNLRMENGTGSDHRTFIVNAQEAWAGSDQKLNRLGEHQALRRPTQFPFFDLLSEVNNPNTELTYHGLKTIGATPVHHLTIHVRDPKRGKQSVWVPQNEQADFYIDAATFLVVRSERVESTQESMNLQVPSTIEFSDYRDVHGVMIPFRIVNTMGRPEIGMHKSTTVFSTVTVNGGVSDSLFSHK